MKSADGTNLRGVLMQAFIGPDARHDCATRRATADGYSILHDGKSHATDQFFLTLMADCIFVHARNVATVNVLKPGIFADLPCAQERLPRCRLDVGHFVGRKKGAEVPGNGRIYIVQKISHTAKLFIRVVVAWNDQSGYFEPDPEPFCERDRIEHRL